MRTAMSFEEERPTTIHAEDALAPRPPWSFLIPALPGGFTRWGWGLMAGWGLVLLGPTLGWAGHLRRAAGWSGLPRHWGERISARDVWELWENGGLQHGLTNSPTVHLMGLGLVIVLWCGWRMQAGPMKREPAWTDVIRRNLVAVFLTVCLPCLNWVNMLRPGRCWTVSEPGPRTPRHSACSVPAQAD